MKRCHCYTILFSLVFCTCVSISYCDSVYSDHQINDNGYVVWSSNSGLGTDEGDIFLYNGSSVIKLTNVNTRGGLPRINNNNQVVWAGGSGAVGYIYFYNGNKVLQLTDNLSLGLQPDINDHGHVVWTGFNAESLASDSGYDVFLYDGSTVTRMIKTDLNDVGARINNDGDVLWVGETFDEENDNESYSEVFYFDGSTIKQLTDNVYDKNHLSLQLNNNGYAVWLGEVGTGDDEIFFYDGLTVLQLTGQDNDYSYPVLNDNNVVIWNGESEAGDGILSYDGTNYSHILTGSFSYDMNDNNHITWLGIDSTSQTYGVFLYDGSTTSKIFDNADWLSYPVINNSDHIAWKSGETMYYYNGSDVLALLYDRGDEIETGDDADTGDEADADGGDDSDGGCFIGASIQK